MIQQDGHHHRTTHAQKHHNPPETSKNIQFLYIHFILMTKVSWLLGTFEGILAENWPIFREKSACHRPIAIRTEKSLLFGLFQYKSKRFQDIVLEFAMSKEWHYILGVCQQFFDNLKTCAWTQIFLFSKILKQTSKFENSRKFILISCNRAPIVAFYLHKKTKPPGQFYLTHLCSRNPPEKSAPEFSCAGHLLFEVKTFNCPECPIPSLRLLWCTFFQKVFIREDTFWDSCIGFGQQRCISSSSPGGSVFMQINCHFRYRGTKTRVENWLSRIFQTLTLKFK